MGPYPIWAHQIEKHVPSTVRVLECCQNNMLLPDFNYNNLISIYNAEPKSEYREIIALTINYNLRYPLGNKINALPSSGSAHFDQSGNISVNPSIAESSVGLVSKVEGQLGTPRARKSLIGQFSPLQGRSYIDLDSDFEDKSISFNNNLLI